MRMADIEAADKVSWITGHKSWAVFDAYADHVTEAAIMDMGKAAAVLPGCWQGRQWREDQGYSPQIQFHGFTSPKGK